MSRQENDKRANYRSLFVAGYLLLVFVTLPADAETFPSSSDEQSELVRVITGTQEQLLADYAEQQKWCDLPIPKAQKGEIVIYWMRDENGRCLKKNFIVEK